MTEAPLDQIRQLFLKANKRVIIISAFIGAKVLDSLLGGTKHVIERSIYVRWDFHDIASGATDWQSWDVARSHSVPMYACPKLHAKLYIADNKVLLGSANATTSGLSGPSKGNLELLILEDAGIFPVKQIIRRVRESSTLANPLGIDISLQSSFENDDRTEDSLPFWLPKSDPTRFLGVMAGTVPYDVESQRDKSALKLSQSVVGRTEIRKAVFNVTVFRIVREAFVDRVRPMSIVELRELLASQASPVFAQLPIGTMERLCRWLGEFGENTVMTPSIDSSFGQLTPGKLLGSEYLY